MLRDVKTYKSAPTDATEAACRGGYMEIHNVSEDVMAELYKCVSVNLCSNVSGQLMVSLMVNPPTSGDPSFPKYEAERDAILGSMQERASPWKKQSCGDSTFCGNRM